MKVLIRNEWQGGFLDYHRPHNAYRIEVRAWRDLERLRGLYFVRPRKPLLVWNYIREFGVAATLKKVRSRLGEWKRNEKYVACGTGIICETPAFAEATASKPENTRFKKGDSVIFVSPHSPCAERIVLHERFIAPAPFKTGAPFSAEALFHAPEGATELPDRFWEGVRGWNEWSGAVLDARAAKKLLKRAEETIAKTPWDNAKRLLTGQAGSPISETREPEGLKQTVKPGAMLFGYGNYARVMILPRIAKHLALRSVHEIDPMLIPRRARGERWDTSPLFRTDETYAAAFIAGFHHMHAPLAAEALLRGMYAVIEKPVATTKKEAKGLYAAFEAAPNKLFVGFHKRYLRFNGFVHRDLGVAPGEPVDYHAIVYEVPVPPLHWYRWASSRSRMLQDGCHWIDYFLYLNDWSEPVSVAVVAGPRGTVNCSIELKNGAFGTIILTSEGSGRIGVRDYIELRAGERTVRIMDGARYRAENGERIIRRARHNKMRCYRNMYENIAERIAKGMPGDSITSIRVSTDTVLQVDEKLSKL